MLIRLGLGKSIRVREYSIFFLLVVSFVIPELSLAIQDDDSYTVLPAGTRLSLRESPEFKKYEVIPRKIYNIVRFKKGKFFHSHRFKKGVHCGLYWTNQFSSRKGQVLQKVKGSFHSAHLGHLGLVKSFEIPIERSLFKIENLLVTGFEETQDSLGFYCAKTLNGSSYGPASIASIPVTWREAKEALGSLVEVTFPEKQEPSSRANFLDKKILVFNTSLELHPGEKALTFSSAHLNLSPQGQVTYCSLDFKEVMNDTLRTIPNFVLNPQFPSCLELGEGVLFEEFAEGERRTGIRWPIIGSTHFNALSCFQNDKSPPNSEGVLAALSRNFSVERGFPTSSHSCPYQVQEPYCYFVPHTPMVSERELLKQFPFQKIEPSAPPWSDFSDQ